MGEGASKALNVLKALFYIVVIGGAALWGYSLYSTRGEWSYRLGGQASLGYVPPYTLHVTVPLEVYDPAGDVMAKLVYYQVYVNGYHVGDGLIPYVSLHKGWNNLTLTLDIDVSKVGCGLAQALSRGENLSVTVKGYAMVDIKTVGGITWRTVTVPFSKEATNIEAPTLSGAAAALLGIYAKMCSNPTAMGGGQLPWP